MTPSKELFALIKSMTRSEKRYFKINSASISGKDDSVYLRLFDAIDAQKEYDEHQLKQFFKNEKFARQFSVAKNYLQHIIIKSLTGYHATLSVNVQINELLQSIEVLYEKRHYSICIKLIQKGKELAEKHEKFAYLDRLIEWESRIYFGMSSFDIVKKIMRHQNDNLKLMQVDLNNKTFALEMFEKTAEFGFVATDEQLEALNRILKEAESKGLAEGGGIMGKYYYYSVWHLYYCCTDNYEKRFEYSEKILSLLESHPHIIEENPGIYVTSLNNYCNSLIGFGKLKKALQVVEKMRQLPLLYNISRWESERINALLLSYDIEIVAHTSSGEVMKAIALENDIQEIFDNPKTFILQKNNLFELCYNLAMAHFLTGNNEQCLEWLFKILNTRDLNHREDLYIAGRLFVLLVHYELGNYMLLNNLVASTQRFLKSKKRLSATESAYLCFIKLCAEHANSNKQKADLIELKQQLEKYPDNAPERKMLHLINLSHWIESKLSGKSMAEIISDDYNRSIQHKKKINKSKESVTS
jgi:hypothetical protein